MNIAFFLTPKVNVSYIYDDFTIRQSLEKMRFHGYTSVPVISRDGKYVGVVSNGDFLWYIVDFMRENIKDGVKDMEKARVKDLLRKKGQAKLPVSPVRITAQIDELVETAMKQNFVPVIDDNDAFVGIVTRRAIIQQLYKEKEAAIS